jgi:small subunit ribosomal protein S21
LGTSNVEHGVQVFVRDNNVDQALKALKRKMQREGVFSRDEAPQAL